MGFMVEPNGKVSDIAVMESSGDKRFETAAVDAVQQTTFIPGTLNGKPIESASTYSIRFVNYHGLPAASPKFLRAFKTLMAAVRAQNQPAADAAMKELTVGNLYEDAYYGLAQYDYAHVWGDDAQQLAGLRRAVASQNDARVDDVHLVLPQDVELVAETTLLQLELRTHEYSEALNRWRRLQADGIDKDTAAKLAPIMQQVKALRSNAAEVAVSGEIQNSGSWFLALFKRQFRIEVRKGYIADVRLRCARGYVYFAFDPKLQYHVRGKVGSCQMQLEGTDGTQFTVVEF